MCGGASIVRPAGSRPARLPLPQPPSLTARSMPAGHLSPGWGQRRRCTNTAPHGPCASRSGSPGPPRLPALPLAAPDKRGIAPRWRVAGMWERRAGAPGEAEPPADDGSKFKGSLSSRYALMCPFVGRLKIIFLSGATAALQVVWKNLPSKGNLL